MATDTLSATRPCWTEFRAFYNADGITPDAKLAEKLAEILLKQLVELKAVKKGAKADEQKDDASDIYFLQDAIVTYKLKEDGGYEFKKNVDQFGDEYLFIKEEPSRREPSSDYAKHTVSKFVRQWKISTPSGQGKAEMCLATVGKRCLITICVESLKSVDLKLTIGEPVEVRAGPASVADLKRVFTEVRAAFDGSYKRIENARSYAEYLKNVYVE